MVIKRRNFETYRTQLGDLVDPQDNSNYWNDPTVNITDNVLATVDMVEKDGRFAGYPEGCFSPNHVAGYYQIMANAGVKDHDRLLELGCGGGRVTILLDLASERFKTQWDIVGIDHSENAINVCRARSPHLEYHAMSMTELPIDDRKFDVVYSCAAVQHNSGWKQDIIFDAVYRTLVPGGLLIFIAENTYATDICPDYVELSPWFRDHRESAGTPAWWIARLADHWFELRYFDMPRNHYVFKKMEGRGDLDANFRV